MPQNRPRSAGPLGRKVNLRSFTSSKRTVRDIRKNGSMSTFSFAGARPRSAASRRKRGRSPARKSGNGTPSWTRSYVSEAHQGAELGSTLSGMLLTGLNEGRLQGLRDRIRAGPWDTDGKRSNEVGSVEAEGKFT